MIDFSNIVHGRENNRHSQMILEDQYHKLSNQCRIVYNLLKQGKRLTVRSAMIQHGIGDLRRRCADLREAGIDVQSEIQKGGFKEYFL